MTWRLAEWLFYNQNCKERATWSLVGGKEKQSSHAQWVTQKRRGDITGLGIFPKEQYMPYIKHNGHGA